MKIYLSNVRDLFIFHIELYGNNSVHVEASVYDNYVAFYMDVCDIWHIIQVKIMNLKTIHDHRLAISNVKYVCNQRNLETI